MTKNRRASLVLAVALSAAAASQASAESRAWTAAKKALPANLMGVGGMSVAQIKSSQLFQQLWPMAMAQSGAQDKFDKFKAACGFDPLDAFDSMVVGMKADEKGAIVIALKGQTEKEIDACITNAAKADGKSATIKKDGAFMKYSGTGGKDIYIKWLTTDTFEIATQPDDKSLLTAMTKGGIDKDKALKTALGAVNTDAAMWGAGNKTQDLPDIKAKMTGLYGSADVKSGTISAEIHAVLDSAKAATDAAAQANTQLAQVKKSGGLPPAFSGLINSVAVKSSGAEVVVTASIAEKDVMGLLMQFAGGMGSGGASAPPAKPAGSLKPH
ncbi:MAG TPA: hypothetical protein VL463_04230 [Kofleriaceae bacterium]|jgi:hypothetical protein|nr:hypothetical protein [Kofleriaceae bacterium]